MAAGAERRYGCARKDDQVLFRPPLKAYGVPSRRSGPLSGGAVIPETSAPSVVEQEQCVPCGLCPYSLTRRKPRH
jgi:hypothetical protein